MDLSISSANQRYLASLQATQAKLQQAQSQVSSGHRLQQVADDPSSIGAIYQLQSQIASNQQTQSNLSAAQSELTSADSTLQSAIQLVSNAISLAAQGATSTATTQSRTILATTVAGLQQTLLSLSQTQVNGRYIFSGDQDTQPTYALDPTKPTGVQLLNATTATRVIQDMNGTSIAVARTATQIFDAQDSLGAPVAGNVFAAINSLLVGLQADDQTAIQTAGDDLKTASDYLNNQLTFYGEAQNRVSDAATLAQKFLLQQQGDLGQVQDADIPAAALTLTREQTQQQAALAVEAKIQQAPNLFSMLA